MKKKKVFKCCIIICLIMLTMFTACSKVFAEINTNYGDQTEVQEPDLNKKMTQSVLLDAIASLIYAIASWVEKLVGDLFMSLTGVGMFPWADRVIFNTVPLLDVNFLNPSNNSMFSVGNTETPLSIIVRRSYYTVFSIAVSFLGIVVGIMAIKLATTALAAKKAQYKEAITKWLFTIIMLFVMHYAIALIFYVNEQMVTIASGMLSEALEGATLPNDIFEAKTDDEKKLIVTNFLDRQTALSVGNVLSFLPGSTNGIQANLPFSDVTTSKEYILEGDNYLYAYDLLDNPDYQQLIIPEARNPGLFDRIFGSASRGTSAIYALQLSIATIKSDDASNKAHAFVEKYSVALTDELRREFVGGHNEKFLAGVLTGSIKRTSLLGSLADTVDLDDAKTKNNIDVVINKERKINQLYYSLHVNGPNSTNNNIKDIIAEMGKFFKETAFTYETNSSGEVIGWKASKLTLQGAILYAIFVFQSVLYLFAYLKRFFYIVVLAIFAPAVIIFDFFGKSMT